MKTYKWKILGLESLLIGILFFALFVSNILSRYLLVVILLLYVFGLYFGFPKRTSSSIHQKQVTVLFVIFACIYLGVLYLLGLHFGFLQAKVQFSVGTFLRLVVPLSIIIILSEIVRYMFLKHPVVIHFKKGVGNISSALTYIAMVLLDLVIYTGVYDLTNLDDFLTALGFVFFASLSSNLLFHYTSLRYREKGIILYRMITTLYIYFMPIVPDIYIFFQSFLRMIFPYGIYIMMEKLYAQSDKTISYVERRRSILGNTIFFTLMVLFIMLISCQFYYGILVIGSRSMTGSINKGDAVVFEKYEGQSIPLGQVIIFEKDGMRTVHRVIDKAIVNGEKRYYTKGDANEKMDSSYITDDEIDGLVLFRIKYIGYPTLWVRELFHT